MLIGELAAATETTAKTLRFYEARGLLRPPARTPAGYRDYATDAVDRVRFIRQAQNAGLTLTQIGEILSIRNGGQPPCGHVAMLVEDRLADVEHRLAELRTTQRQLRDLRARLQRLDPRDCEPSSICSAVDPNP